MKSKILFAALAAVTVFALSANQSVYQPQVGVKVGGFWGEKYKMLVCKWIPHCIRQMEKGGEGEELMNLVATGDKLRGEKPRRSFKGCKWSDAYPYNIVEAASLALELDPGDDEDLKAGQEFLRRKIEEWIPIILSAQEPSGYIDSYTALRNVPHFERMADHEFYVMGYFIEMGIAHHRATGERRLFDAAIKCADHLDSIFGPPPKRTWMNGHPGLEYALCRLSDATGDEKYARLAQHFVRNQHTCKDNHSDYNQAEQPAEDMREAKGHAVRANYFYAAMAAISNRLGDQPLGEAAKRLFDSIVDRKMYLTGGIGADYAKEAYGKDYDLPQDAYAESCAGCGLEFFAREARRIVGSDKAEAVRERVIYNNILGAIGRDGKKFYYQNPLSSNRPRTSWHGCPCCVGNVPRTLLALKDTVFSAEGDTLFINQYMDIENAKVMIGGKEYLVSLKTGYPSDGKVMLTTDAPIKIVARFPDRAESQLYRAEPEVAYGYRKIVSRRDTETQRESNNLCASAPLREYIFELPLPEQKVTADERVESCRGRVAYQRGPIVYSWENGEKLPNYDRLNNGGYSEVWRAVDAQAAPKPLLPGFHPDPSVCLGHDGAYYLTTSTFMWRPGLPIYRSEDFRDWSLVGHAIADFKDVALKEDIGLNDDDGVWAPTIRYNDGTYYLVFTFHGKKSRNYLTTAKDTSGPWTTPIHIKEADGGIDPSLFFDDDGKVYWTANTAAKPQEWKSQTAIYVQEIDLAAGKLVGERKVISNGTMTQAKYAEGPHLYKMGKTYILVAAEGGTDFDHVATAMKSKSVWGPYTPTRTNPVLTRRDRGKGSPLQATGHADLVKMADGGKEYYYAVFLGKRPVGEDRRVILGRETFACPALWRDGDLIFQDERLIAGEVVTPEEECETILPGAKIHRVQDFKFDETIDAKDGEAMILYRSADGNITLDGPGTLRMKSDDGITVKCYRDGELVKEVSTSELLKSHTRFNGTGIGILNAVTVAAEVGRADVRGWFEENWFGKAPLERPVDEMFGETNVTFAAGRVSIPLEVHLPERLPAPVIIQLCFGDEEPLPEATKQGFALVRWQMDSVARNPRKAREPFDIALNPVFREYGPTERTDTSWGSVAAWAWGFRRVVDWVETRSELDSKRITIVGFSRAGKAALWAGAQDERIALTVSCQSGCGGAMALKAHAEGAETLERLGVNFPNWMAGRLYAMAGKEDALEYDAPDLLKLFAPRKVLVLSANDAKWLGPEAEQAAAKEAGVLHWTRPGKHSMTADDWQEIFNAAKDDTYVFAYFGNDREGMKLAASKD